MLFSDSTPYSSIVVVGIFLVAIKFSSNDLKLKNYMKAAISTLHPDSALPSRTTL